MTEPADDEYFCVEFSHNPHAEKAVVKYFRRFDEAMAEAEDKAKKFRAVWVSEWGAYKTENDKPKEGWVYFWWTPATEYGEIEGRGKGWPPGSEYSAEYVPLAPKVNL